MIGKLIEKVGLDHMENPIFWMQRHLFEIVENRLKNKVNFFNYIFWWLKNRVNSSIINI